MGKSFYDIQNVIRLRFEGDWAKLRPKICLLRQFWAKYLEQSREIQKNWTGQEKFDIYFCLFFTIIAKSNTKFAILDITLRFACG